MHKIGFIGAGNMATALLRGMLEGGMSPDRLMAFDINPERMDAMRALGVKTAESAIGLCDACDTTVLAVKPQYLQDVLDDLRQNGHPRDVLSIAVGWTQVMLEAALPNARGIAHAMPNTPALVREGVIAFNDIHSIEPGRFSAIQEAFALCGRVLVIPEALMGAITGISGSGPAYVYLFIEALADAGVRQGLTRQLAYTLSAQTLLGASKMVLETGKHPGALKDEVASPGGTTIEAIYALEKAGLRGAVMDAVDACARKAKEMESK